MTDFTPPAPSLTWRLRGGFLAGALATVLFHQLTLVLLWGLGIAPIPPFALTPTWPLGLPAVASLTVWGGVWGMGLALIYPRFPRRADWMFAWLFGAVLPTAVALTVVLPLKGQPIGGGWGWPRLLTAVLCNGAWGVGTGLIVKWLSDRANGVGADGIRPGR